MKITTHYESMPAKWVAIDTDSYDGAEDAGPQCVGYGNTELEAVIDLADQIETAAYERGWRDGVKQGHQQGSGSE